MRSLSLLPFSYSRAYLSEMKWIAGEGRISQWTVMPCSMKMTRLDQPEMRKEKWRWKTQILKTIKKKERRQCRDSFFYLSYSHCSSHLCVCPIRWDWRMYARARCVRLSNFTIWRHRWRYFYRIESKWKREIAGRLWFYYMSILSRNETRERRIESGSLCSFSLSPSRSLARSLCWGKTNWSKDDREGWDANDNRQQNTPEAQRREEHERRKSKTRRRWSWWWSYRRHQWPRCAFLFLVFFPSFLSPSSSCGFSSGNESRPAII